MKNSKLKCPVCGLTNNEKFWAMPKYLLAKCNECGLVWDFSISQEIKSIYVKEYFSNEDPKGGYANYFEGMKINRKTFADRLNKIENKLGKKGKLLDVGCALGECLLEARRLGWKNAFGVELSDFAYQFAKRRGLKVKKGKLGNSFPSNTFDAISYQDVIEHIPDPLGELKNAKRVLKPGGIIFLVTPNIGGLWSHVLGRYWYHYKPKEHVIYFSLVSIERALVKAGFKNVEVKRTYHILSVEYILNRLSYYSPLFRSVLKLIEKTPLRSVPITAYTGELEAWGVK